MCSKTRSNNLANRWVLFICSPIWSFACFIDDKSKERKLWRSGNDISLIWVTDTPRLWLNIAVCYWSGWKLPSLISITRAVKCFEMLSLLITYVGCWCITCPRTSISFNISDLYGSKREHADHLSQTGQDLFSFIHHNWSHLLDYKSGHQGCMHN